MISLTTAAEVYTVVRFVTSSRLSSARASSIAIELSRKQSYPNRANRHQSPQISCRKIFRTRVDDSFRFLILVGAIRNMSNDPKREDSMSTLDLEEDNAVKPATLSTTASIEPQTSFIKRLTQSLSKSNQALEVDHRSIPFSVNQRGIQWRTTWLNFLV